MLTIDDRQTFQWHLLQHFLRLHEWLSKPPWNYLALGDPSFREGRWEPKRSESLKNFAVDSVTLRTALALAYLM